MKDFVSSAPRKKRSRTSSKNANFSGSSRLTRLLIGGGLVAVIFLLGLVLVRSLHWSDFVQAPSQTTTLFFTEKVDQTGSYVVRFLFDELQIDVYPIPADLGLEVMGGYGQYRFQAVYPLLILEGKDLPFIRSAFSLSTGILLDELWRSDVTRLDLNSQNRFQLFFLQNIFSNKQVAFTQKLTWLALLFDQRTEYVLHEPLTSLPALQFRELEVSMPQSACTVALINTTPLNGLAARIADLLESHHFRVVRTVTDTTQVGKTTVLFAENLSADCLVILDKVEKLVPGGVEKQLDVGETVRNRADLVVKLGTDLAQ